MKHKPMTTSKRRIDRAYHNGHTVGMRAGEAIGKDAARRELQAKYERMVLPKVEGWTQWAWLGERPVCPVQHVRLISTEGLRHYPQAFSLDACTQPYAFETATFECVPKAQEIELRGGLRTVVRWVDWQFKGLS